MRSDTKAKFDEFQSEWPRLSLCDVYDIAADALRMLPKEQVVQLIQGESAQQNSTPA